MISVQCILLYTLYCIASYTSRLSHGDLWHGTDYIVNICYYYIKLSRSLLNICCLCLYLQESVATYFMNNPIDIAPAFEGRATLEVDLQNRVSTLTLKKVTMRDSRRFQCSVLIPNDDEGTTAASTSLLVLGES